MKTALLGTILLTLTWLNQPLFADAVSAMEVASTRASAFEAEQLLLMQAGVDANTATETLLKKPRGPSLAQDVSTDMAASVAFTMILRGALFAQDGFTEAAKQGRTMTPQLRAQIIEDAATKVMRETPNNGQLWGGFTAGVLASHLAGRPLAASVAAGATPAALKSLVAGGVGTVVEMTVWGAADQLIEDSSQLLNEKELKDYNDNKLNWRVRTEIAENAAKILSNSELRKQYLHDLWVKRLSTPGFVLMASGFTTGAMAGEMVPLPGAPMVLAMIGGGATVFLPTKVTEPIDEGVFQARKRFENQVNFACRREIERSVKLNMDGVSIPPTVLNAITTRGKLQTDFAQAMGTCREDRNKLFSTYFEQLHKLLLLIRDAQGKETYKPSAENRNQLKVFKFQFNSIITEMKSFYATESQRYEEIRAQSHNDKHTNILNSEIDSLKVSEERMGNLLNLFVNLDTTDSKVAYEQNYILSRYSAKMFKESRLANDVQATSSSDVSAVIANMPPLEDWTGAVK